MEANELSEEEMRALRDAKPSWMKDGLGFRGDVVQVSNTKADLNFESKVVYRRPELNTQTT